MLTPQSTTRYAKDIEQLRSRGRDLSKLKTVIDLLCTGEPLPPQYRVHPLQGKMKGYRDCHIEPDWILIYKIDMGRLLLILSRTGSHSDLRF
ncbi:MAG: type II toxin-antitoxin system YafQ family toxin [Selenomonadaceae bacterium]|nr:type II toxin-antitoxin system YafQ family toxin [Selenomonadaceae bacterium]